MSVIATPIPAAAEPLTLAEVKASLRLEADYTEEDAVLTRFIAAARAYCEDYQGRRYITRTLTQVFDAFPLYQEPIRLRWPPLIAVSAIEYTAPDGTETLVEASRYVVDTYTHPGRIAPAQGYYWPTARRQIAAVRVTYQAGYGPSPSDVPESVRQAMSLLVGHWYENREASSDKPNPAIAFAVEALLQSDRITEI